ncbi:MAG: hypothetical protein WCV99_10695 [Sterolibacterium sp.]|jgi:hypothetical protein
MAGSVSTMVDETTGADIPYNMPILKADGTVSMVTTDVSSSASMQATLQNAGMPVNNAANTANIIMGGMR